MLTSTGEYALRAMIHIAKQDPDRFILAQEFGADLSIPERYLSKILGILTRRDLLEARRGRGGGYRLKKPPDSISVFDILEAVDRIEHFERCILGFKECSEESPCAMHAVWREFKDRILALLKGVSLEDLAKERVNQEMAFRILQVPDTPKQARRVVSGNYPHPGGVD